MLLLSANKLLFVRFYFFHSDPNFAKINDARTLFVFVIIGVPVLLKLLRISLKNNPNLEMGTFGLTNNTYNKERKK